VATFAAVILAACLAIPGLHAAERASRGKKSGVTYPPSENQGKTGSYQCSTNDAKIKYWVYVPSSYSDKNPAGLSIFFHGQGSAGGASSFNNRRYLEQFNLIGINMEYTDGDNLEDYGGKVKAAEQAVLQTMADYKVIHGRGAMASFSGGGIIHMLYFNQHAKGKVKRLAPQWSFCHNSLFGSNFWSPATGGVPMSWYIGLHENERNMGKPTLGASQTQRASELLEESIRGETFDVIFLYVKGEGHGIGARDVDVAMSQFRRTDLTRVPFIYLPDYPESQLANLAAALNSLEYGKAEMALKVIRGNAQMSPEIKAKADELQAKLTQRVEDVIALAKELADNDPILCQAYSKCLLAQFSGHPRAADLKAALTPGLKKFSSGGLKKIKDKFAKEAPGMLNMDSGTVPFKHKGLLEQVVKSAGPSSQCGIMAQVFLDCLAADGAASEKKK
jgi:hypothetical protein